MLQPVEKQNTIQRDGVEAVSGLQCSFPFRSTPSSICAAFSRRSRFNRGLRPSDLVCCVQGRAMKMDDKTLARFMAKINVNAETGCWEWTDRLSRDGYGKFASALAHRVSYEHFVCAIVPGLQIDHLCRNRCCVNPAHIEAVTQRENLMRGIGFAAVNSMKTHCVRGHALGVSSAVYKRADGRCYRTCVICRRVRRNNKKDAA